MRQRRKSKIGRRSAPRNARRLPFKTRLFLFGATSGWVLNPKHHDEEDAAECVHTKKSKEAAEEQSRSDDDGDNSDGGERL